MDATPKSAVGAIKGGQVVADTMGMARVAGVLTGALTIVEVGASLVTGYTFFATTSHLMAADECAK